MVKIFAIVISKNVILRLLLQIFLCHSLSVKKFVIISIVIIAITLGTFFLSDRGFPVILFAMVGVVGGAFFTFISLPFKRQRRQESRAQARKALKNLGNAHTKIIVVKGSVTSDPTLNAHQDRLRNTGIKWLLRMFLAIVVAPILIVSIVCYTNDDWEDFFSGMLAVALIFAIFAIPIFAYLHQRQSWKITQDTLKKCHRGKGRSWARKWVKYSYSTAPKSYLSWGPKTLPPPPKDTD